MFYSNRFNLDLNDYLFINRTIHYDLEDREELKNNLFGDLSIIKLDIKLMNKFILNSFNKRIKGVVEIYNDKAPAFSDLYIDILFPFFEIIYKSEILEFFCVISWINEINNLITNASKIKSLAILQYGLIISPSRYFEIEGS